MKIKIKIIKFSANSDSIIFIYVITKNKCIIKNKLLNINKNIKIIILIDLTHRLKFHLIIQ